jgi:hypothetical protein
MAQSTFTNISHPFNVPSLTFAAVGLQLNPAATQSVTVHTIISSTLKYGKYHGLSVANVHAVVTLFISIVY